ncbi:MAG: SigB/SigF/SigG family RNA polymerase sigma factor [Clostridia bacterium]
MYDTNEEYIKEAINGSNEAMENIINNNQGLVWNIVARFSGRGYEKEELYQIGAIGLIKAVKRFDFSFGVKFSTYAVPYIMGEIKRFIRDDGPIKISRSIKELNSKINELQNKNLKEAGQELSVKEVARKLNVSKEEVAVAIESARPLESINEEAYNEENGESKISKISNKEDDVNKLINRLTINRLIQELDEREKKIIILRYFREKTQTEVANLLGISQVQVSRIEKKILNSMRTKIAN